MGVLATLPIESRFGDVLRTGLPAAGRKCSEDTVGGAEYVRVLKLNRAYADSSHQTLRPPTSAWSRPSPTPDRAS
jgi:hypothetical protein